MLTMDKNQSLELIQKELVFVQMNIFMEKADLTGLRSNFHLSTSHISMGFMF